MKKFTVLAVSVLASFVLASCGSTPTEDAVIPTEPEVEIPVIDVDALNAEIAASRQLALESGADVVAPELLQAIDDYYEAVKEDPAALSAASGDINLLYKTLASYAKAKGLKSQIDEKNPSAYDKKDYDEGVAALEKIEAAIKNAEATDADRKSIPEAAEKAVAAFNAVLADLEVRNNAAESYKKAQGLKAQIDALSPVIFDKKDYDAASENLAKVDAAYASEEAITEDILAESEAAIAGYTIVLADLEVRNNAAESYKKAQELKAQIDALSPVVFDKKDYDAASENLAKVEAAYASEEVITSDIKADADAAVAAYTTVLADLENRIKASSTCKKAEELKAQIDALDSKVLNKKEYDSGVANLAKATAILDSEEIVTDDLFTYADAAVENFKAVLSDVEIRNKTSGSYESAKALKDQIDALKLKSFDKKDYNAGVEKLNSIAAVFNSSAAITDETLALADAAIADFNAVLKDVELRNSALEAYNKAKEAKELVDSKNLASLDANDYKTGLENFEKVTAAYASDEAVSKDIAASAGKAYTSFNKVYIVAYKKLAKDERAAAYDAKKLADSVKAGVSRKAEYKAATDAFQKGDTLYSMQNSEKALESYKTAKDQYTYLYKDLEEKRAAAMAVLQAAKKSVEESEKVAAEADVQSPLTKKVQGIEDEDAVLLEADNYENPEDAEIDVAEELTIEEQVEIIADEVSEVTGVTVEVTLPASGQEK